MNSAVLYARATAALAALALTLAPRPAAGWTRPPALAVRPPFQNTDVGGLLQRALSYLGHPYSLGGVGNPAFDCSGFVCRVYAEQGWALPRVSRDQARAGRPVARDALEPGDMLFFAESGRPISHVGIYLGNGQMVHASSGRGEVTVAALSARWFRTRWAGARRVLDDPSRPAVVSVEDIEHRGDSALLPFVDRPARFSVPQLGFRWPAPQGSGLGLSALGATEDEQWGALVVPEASWLYVPWGFELTVAVPIRFDAEGATVGPVDSVGDALKFLRRLRLGLPGARFEMAFERDGSFGMVEGDLLHDFSPALASRGLPGLSVQRSPLSFSVAARPGDATLQLLIDDVAFPGVLAAGGAMRWTPWFATRAVAVFDSKGRYRDPVPADGAAMGPRREEVLGGELGFDLAWRRRRFEVGLRTAGQFLQAVGRTGAGLRSTVFGRLALEDRARTEFGLDLGGGVAGAHFVDGFFGPTYAAGRVEHLAARDRGRSARGLVFGQFSLRRGALGLRAGYGQGLGPHALDFDRKVEAVFELRGLSLGAGRVAELSAGYASRGLGSESPLNVATLAASLRWTSWLSAELYAQLGGTFSVGAGLTVTWLP